MVSLTQKEKGGMGTKEHGPKWSWDPLGDNNSAHGPTYKQMPNNPGNKGHWGNELVILSRPVKTKGIHPLQVRIPETRKKSGQFAVLEWAKRSTEVDPKCCLQGEFFKRKNSNETPQSSKSTILLMASTCPLRDLGIQSTCKSIPFRKTSWKIETESSCKPRFILPLRIMDGM